MSRKLLLMIFLFFICISSYGQGTTVRGVVKDISGDALPGVSVKVKGGTGGTTTDGNGQFTLKTPDNAVLIFSYIGYQVKEEAVQGSSTLEITLLPSNQELDEVVVVGYGTQRKGDITGAVGVVSQEAFESRPNTQFGSILQGKTAGVQVSSPGGKPNAGLNIRIRGTSSITSSSDPLYVVDGVPIADTRSINPADIESMSILKDAASAAIYGAQGANGVVLITTKKGKEGKTRVDLNAYAGFSSVWRKLDVLNASQYRELMTALGRNTDWDRYTANTNWQDEVFQQGASQNYQLAFSGKSNKTTYYLSGGWTKQKGAVRSAEMDRYNFKVNLQQEVNSWLTLGTNLGYTRYHDVDVADNQAVNQGGVIMGILSTPPNIGIYNPNGTFTSNPFQDWENPLAFTDGSERGYRNQRVIGNAYAEITFLPGLKFRSNFGIDAGSGVYEYFLDPIRTSYGRAQEGIGRYNTDQRNYWIADNTLTYNKQLEKHNFGALLGMVAQKTQWENSETERTGFSGTSITTPNAGSVIRIANVSKREKANVSVIGRVNYDFDGKYLFTANFRADNSSNFGSENKWGYFPSFSAGWRLSKENFLNEVSWLDDLKLRAGWGIVGNDNVGEYAYWGRVASDANYPFGGVISPGTRPSTLQNDNLKWEETKQTNIGLDISVFNARLNFSADAYLKKTSDLLLNVPVPRATGFDYVLQNAGALENKGLEFQVNSRNLAGALKWETDLNISLNRNKVSDLAGTTIFGANISGRGDLSYTTVGNPIGMFYGYVFTGVDPQTGDALYLRNDGTSSNNPSPDDRRIIGNPNPDFIYGLTNTFGYKNFGFSIFLQGSQGNDIYNGTRVETEGMIDAKNQTTAVLDRWTSPGQLTNVPRAVPDNTNNSRNSTRFVENGSYLRVKSVTLSYNLPETLLSRLKLSNVKVYVTGENLFTVTNYKGFDPEVNAFTNTNDATQNKNTFVGIDYGTYPQTRNLIFGLNVSF
ncbi:MULTISPECIES: SusC/RagA family TonB-linked outer membrane protein [Olivibacter]|uniref:SusC/RagA family TonB-linked outer membrane protein n=1 Tax=Olivibacter oleidegradans TaxID=760123 RepID=A0ABV6HRI4_9SPHI|nr:MULTISPECIES: TonB-dependent receptor [Olivibacter]MDM8176136.1 TonB-dependent receptor [Olivibacter sp. 47]QEL00899.1 TonB-dependent receptor [Olivibacter sp. LS-1]